MIEQRKNNPYKEQDLYQEKNLKPLIKKERRQDELEKLYEVSQQKKIWRNVAIIAIIINVILILLAIVGYLKNV